MLGSAVGDDAPTDYWSPIASQAWTVDNFHSENDGVLRHAFGAAEWETALGLYGVPGTSPWNYTDRAVDYVSTHFDYFVPREGCVEEVVATW